MTDRIYPSTAKTAAKPQPPPPAKPYPNPPIRHHNPYRTATSKPPLRRRRSISARRCLCQACLWSTIVILVAILLAGIAAAAFYALYHPHLPQFSPTSLKISSFNLTTTSDDGVTHLTTRVNLTLSSKNPNPKISFFYDPFTATLLSSSDVALSNGSFSAFNGTPNGVNMLHATMGLSSQLLDADSVNSLRADLRSKKGLPLKIVMDTMVRVKFEKLSTRKIGIRITCDGIRGALPKGKNIISSNTLNAKCKVDLRIRILKRIFQ